MNPDRFANGRNIDEKLYSTMMRVEKDNLPGEVRQFPNFIRFSSKSFKDWSFNSAVMANNRFKAEVSMTSATKAQSVVHLTTIESPASNKEIEMVNTFLFITRTDQRECDNDHTGYYFNSDLPLRTRPIDDNGGFVYSLGFQFPEQSGSKKFMISYPVTAPHPAGFRALFVSDATKNDYDIKRVVRELANNQVRFENLRGLRGVRRILQVFDFGKVRLNKEDIRYAASKQNL